MSLNKSENGVNQKIELLQCSTRISVLLIISHAIWFRQITGGSWKIHRMNFSRVSDSIFSMVLNLTSDWWLTDETYEAEVRAVVEQQYLPEVPVSVQHMAILNLLPLGCFENADEMLFYRQIPIWEGTEGNNCCWKNWNHPWICQSLHMKVIAGRKLPAVNW